MRKVFMALGIFILVNLTPTYIQTIAHGQQDDPAYAKWGKHAMKETQSKYPNANIIDYLHEGSETRGNSTIEKFKLWLKEGDSEFGIFVRIEYTTETEEVITIELQETSR
ncbi:DUF3889 domain-containing protein [Filibacter tadaridae]|uniref:DUF3889 domain-containing protein n=1 Tax=Filibacter tadaridae TaxID=2483811 RepID=A0A3P5WXZ3_9BACL|nr:DUF3889 domain-containing protein [Filibacter tadaridae]VDC28085.1 hypothetical protein FILTAD_01706 [Filibacter tadaridae]